VKGEGPNSPSFRGSATGRDYHNWNCGDEHCQLAEREYDMK